MVYYSVSDTGMRNGINALAYAQWNKCDGILASSYTLVTVLRSYSVDYK